MYSYEGTPSWSNLEEGEECELKAISGGAQPDVTPSNILSSKQSYYCNEVFNLQH